jgi:protein phosphatase
MVVAVVGLRIYVNRQWYVGASGEQVAIYHGIPTTVLGFDLSHVAAPTDLAATEVERIRFYHGLRDGITTDSFETAQTLVSQMRQDVQALRGGAP